jgi:hypothetical protein
LARKLPHGVHKIPQLTLLWRTFGSSGFVTKPEYYSKSGGTLLSSFIQRVPDCIRAPVFYTRPSNHSISYAENIRFCNKLFKKEFAAVPYLEKAFCDADWLLNNGGFQ